MRHSLRRKPKPVPIKRHPRLLARGDGFKVLTIGRHHDGLRDGYARLLGSSWKIMVAFMAGVYLFLNAIFAIGYLMIPGGLTGARPGSIEDAFFFSVQTLATIGYGGITPNGLAANLLVTLESMFGFAFYGVVTGLVFSKFSRPTARVLFSNKAIIGMHDGKLHFMLRLANERNNRIVDASAKMTLMRDEVSIEGKMMRRFYDLPLVRREIPVLRLTWTLMHTIDEKSPLYEKDAEELRAMETEIIVSLQGLDETLSQTIQARHSYITDEIVYNASFEDVLYRRKDYVLEVRYDRFHSLKEPPKNDAA